MNDHGYVGADDGAFCSVALDVASGNNRVLVSWELNCSTEPALWLMPVEARRLAQLLNEAADAADPL